MLGKFSCPLLKVSVPLVKTLWAPLASLVSTSAVDDATHKKKIRRSIVRA